MEEESIEILNLYPFQGWKIKMPDQNDPTLS
ncbi:hypothetical protein J2T04_001532 [Chryseobacterium lathyri]|uniref:Uncharacterized protein n=1 Tax=Chryseobacterium lathyri TaxID=395933 RepID=A0ABT9SK24_9FLAO|nr:hypothetical protein [Chryseobacterium lathyri]